MIGRAIDTCPWFIMCDKTCSLIIWSWLILLKDTKFFSLNEYTWTDSLGKTLNWKCTHTTWREMMDWPWADLGNPFCTCLKKGNSHLKHKFRTPTSHGSSSSLRYGAVSAVRTCLTTGLHLGPEPSTACSSTGTLRLLLPIGAGFFWTEPLPVKIL